jgi:Bacterial regulatory protein, Fis family
MNRHKTSSRISSIANCTLAEASRQHVLEALHETKWVLGGCQGAAARLGLPRTTLVYRMQKLRIFRGQNPGRSRRPIVRTPDASELGLNREGASSRLGESDPQSVYP